VILACFELTLYCDGCDRNWPHGQAKPDTVTGGSRAQCARIARQRGWRLVWKNDKAFCPTCTHKQHTSLSRADSSRSK
jgi:hypothetical protein